MENAQLVIYLFCSGAVLSDAGARTLASLWGLILNTSPDLKVMAMGCGSELISTMLTITSDGKVAEGVGDRVTVTFDLFCHADTPAISWFTKLQSCAPSLLHYPCPTNIHIHILDFSFSDTYVWCKSLELKKEGALWVLGRSMAIAFFSTPK